LAVRPAPFDAGNFSPRPIANDGPFFFVAITPPLILTGGKDYMVWLVNAVTGKIMANLAGHDSDVTFEQHKLSDCLHIVLFVFVDVCCLVVVL
jgi:hypothetical protein